MLQINIFKKYIIIQFINNVYWYIHNYDKFFVRHECLNFSNTQNFLNSKHTNIKTISVGENNSVHLLKYSISSFKKAVVRAPNTNTNPIGE